MAPNVLLRPPCCSRSVAALAIAILGGRRRLVRIRLRVGRRHGGSWAEPRHIRKRRAPHPMRDGALNIGAIGSRRGGEDPPPGAGEIGGRHHSGAPYEVEGQLPRLGQPGSKRIFPAMSGLRSHHLFRRGRDRSQCPACDQGCQAVAPAASRGGRNQAVGTAADLRPSQMRRCEQSLTCVPGAARRSC